ncbi:ABC transporter ATP-binding protein [Streptomyces canus]|uniref:ABC transporter ATP-binding protein n=1 Tax=Streptomyces canus TaxID=58343 RepID=UPI00225B06E4|nr:ABC transporter ATP-binding protein [Streptomyces canus]MCX4852237.1 ABC transporter ATP-binding protein [Streptomyces canus]
MSAVIEVQNLRKKYGDVVVVDDVSFTVEKGEIFGILGSNGAGKTTAVECIEGLRNRDGGNISVLGLDPYAERAEITRQLDIRLQGVKPSDRLQVAEALTLYSSFYRDPADWRVLIDSLGLTSRTTTNLGELSHGQKQRLSIALALVGNPQVAVFDELTNGLDPHARRETWETIEAVRASGVTILLVTHFMEEAERLCDRVALLNKGRVAAVDTPSGLIQQIRGNHRIMFHPSLPLDDDLLTRLPGVTGVTCENDHVTVTATADVLHLVLSELARHGIVPEGLRVERVSLEDAFLALTASDPTER